MRASIILLCALLAACPGGGSGGDRSNGLKPRATSLVADTADIRAVAVAEPADPPLLMAKSASDEPPAGEVMTVEGDGGEPEPVFTQRSVAAYDTTVGKRQASGKTLLVMNGVFEDLDDGQGGTFTCYLLAVPVGADGQAAVCLADDAMLGAEFEQVIPAAITEEGASAVGAYPATGGAPEKVYFALNRVGGGSRIMRWNGADSITLIREIEEGSFTEFYGGRALVTAFGPRTAASGHVVVGSPGFSFDYSGNQTLSLRSPVLFRGAVVFPTRSADGIEGNQGFYVDQERGHTVSFTDAFSPACEPPADSQNAAGGPRAAYWITASGDALCKVYEPETNPNDLYYLAMADDTANTTWTTIAGRDGTAFASAERNGQPLLVQLDLTVGGTTCSGVGCETNTDTNYDGTDRLAALGLVSVDAIKFYRDGLAIEGQDMDGAKTVYFNTASDAAETPADPQTFSSYEEVD